MIPHHWLVPVRRPTNIKIPGDIGAPLSGEKVSNKGQPCSLGILPIYDHLGDEREYFSYANE